LARARHQTDPRKDRIRPLAPRHARGRGRTKIDELLKLDEARRKSLAEVETLKSLRNRVSKEIGALMGQKKLAEAEAKKPRRKIWAKKFPRSTRRRRKLRPRATR
jgi:seryl-tRNA synthetase